MRSQNVKSPADALAYALDCTLATVDDMAMKKSRPKSEYARQKSIAQQILDWCVMFNVNIESTRGKEIVANKLTVDQYAAKLEKSFGKI